MDWYRELRREMRALGIKNHDFQPCFRVRAGCPLGWKMSENVKAILGRQLKDADEQSYGPLIGYD